MEKQWKGDLSVTDKIIADDLVAHAAPLTATGPDQIRGREALNAWVSGSSAPSRPAWYSASMSARVRTEITVTEVRGREWLEEVVIQIPAGRETLSVEGLFVLIGAAPLTASVSDWLSCDEGGYVLAGPDLRKVQGKPVWTLERDPLLLETSQPGVFVAGDVRHGSVKRVASAVGEGATAASLVNKFVAARR